MAASTTTRTATAAGWRLTSAAVAVVAVCCALLASVLLPRPPSLGPSASNSERLGRIHSFQPAAWTPPAPPALDSGPFKLNSALQAASKLFAGQVWGPEDVLADVDGSGWLAGSADGQVKKLWRHNGSVTTWAVVGGHPLGLEWVQPGEVLAVCEPGQGLLLVSRNGSVTLVSSEADGVRLRLVDNVDVSAQDGCIYFSDASSKYTLATYPLDVLEARPHGRLLCYDPSTRRTETLLEGLYFANGVALSQKEDFVLVAETARYRITRYYRKGPKAGLSDVFIDNLPGFPDNINCGSDGLFWVALFMPRQWLLDALHPYPRLKALLPFLPTWAWQRFTHAGMVLALDESARVVHWLTDASLSPHVAQLTGAREAGGELVLGSLVNGYVGVLPVLSLPHLQ